MKKWAVGQHGQEREKDKNIIFFVFGNSSVTSRAPNILYAQLQKLIARAEYDNE